MTKNMSIYDLTNEISDTKNNKNQSKIIRKKSGNPAFIYFLPLH